MTTTVGQVAQVVALALLIWLGTLGIRRGSGWAVLGWSAIAAAVYIGVASPLGQQIWGTIGGWSNGATAWLQRMKGVTA